jgi:hypothetical protein
MPTITITQKMGWAIRRLQQGWRINKVKRGRWGETRYYWVDETGAELEEEEFVKLLEKSKFLEVRPVRGESAFVRHARRAWKASQTCINLKLPPEKFWISE